MNEAWIENKLLDNPVFNSISDAVEDVYVYVCDMETRLSRWSKQAIDYFQLPGEYMYDVQAIWLQKIHPDDRHIFLNDIGAVFSGTAAEHRCQYRAINRFGEYVWLECNGKVHFNSDGSPLLFSGVMRRIDDTAKYDSLTKLLTIKELNSASFQGRQGAMLLIGLDRFRSILNTYGYGFSNRVLADISLQMQRMLRERDTLYRFSGDEFLFDLPGSTAEDAKRLFFRIKNMLEDIHDFGDHVIRLSASGGITEYPGHSDNVETLISHLEHCVQYAKEKCRSQAVVYEPFISEIHTNAMRMRTALSESIQNGFRDFELYYQPIISLKDDMMYCEVLLRWRFNGKIIRPTVFIPLLEESGEIIAVGEWVMKRAMEQIRDWRESGLVRLISINTSPLQYYDTSFAERAIAYAQKLRIHPDSVAFELTESYGVDDFEALKKSIDMMRRFGFKVMMDDFGIEHSTMGLLRELRVDGIKIDHTFVSGLRNIDHSVDSALIKAIIDMGHKIGLRIVGEGIEDLMLKEIISEMGADYLQGDLYSMPVPKEEFEAFAICFAENRIRRK